VNTSSFEDRQNSHRLVCLGTATMMGRIIGQRSCRDDMKPFSSSFHAHASLIQMNDMRIDQPFFDLIFHRFGNLITGTVRVYQSGLALVMAKDIREQLAQSIVWYELVLAQIGGRGLQPRSVLCGLSNVFGKNGLIKTATSGANFHLCLVFDYFDL
jgi:hypothetical protein